MNGSDIDRGKYKYSRVYARYIKRFFDILISVMIFPFVLIISIPISIAIKLEDGGSVFFLGPRYGRDMRKFNMLKFRSMKMNAADIRNADGTTYNSENDERQTRVGRFLRKTSLDELPQFLNVLKGDMSFIGPRPSPMGNEATYTDFIKRKFSVRPGITGLNQALLRNTATLDERYANDVYYAEHVCFSLDVKIVLITVKSVLKQKNIYNS